MSYLVAMERFLKIKKLPKLETSKVFGDLLFWKTTLLLCEEPFWNKISELSDSWPPEMATFISLNLIVLHKKWSFPLKIFPINVNPSFFCSEIILAIPQCSDTSRSMRSLWGEECESSIHEGVRFIYYVRIAPDTKTYVCVSGGKKC